jgi:hypothetical protein
MTAILVLVVAALGPPAAPDLVALPAAPQVEGVVAGAPKELRPLEAALGDSLGRQGLGLALTRADRITADEVTRVVGRAEHVVARFRLDLTSLPLAKLYLLDGERRRVYVRWLSLPRGLDPVAVELIRFVVESSVEAIRAGRDIGVSREEYDRSLKAPAGPLAPSALGPPASPPLRPPAVELVAAIKYESTLMARGHYQQGPGISLGARLPHLWIGADLLARLPMTIVGDTADARIWAGAMRVTGAIPLISSRLASLAAGLGAGIDVSQIRPGASRADLTATPSFWATSPFLRLFTAVERDFGRLSVAAVIGVDIDLLGERYVVAEASGKQEVFVPGRARPLAAILLGARR